MANNLKNQEKTEEVVPGGGEKLPFIKEVICTGIFGKVKWFNVKRGYGFVCRNDNQEDVFIHQSAIVKSNPSHPRKSVGENEEIQFDIVKGEKGNEAANVCGADGNHVRGSDYALRYQRGMRFRGRGRGRGRGAPGLIRSRGPSEDAENHPQEFVRGGGPPRGGRSFRGGRPYMVQYRKPYPNYEMPPPPQFYYEYDYFRGPSRGRGGFRGPRVFRGGPPQREMGMNFPPYEYESGYERRPSRGPRGRGRGGRARFGRGRGGPRDNGPKDDGEELHEENNAVENSD